MTVNSDSIQTLLRQRRQLRDCLKELKGEISRLNEKASNMSETHDVATVIDEKIDPGRPTEEKPPLTLMANDAVDLPIMTTQKTESEPQSSKEGKIEPSVLKPPKNNEMDADQILQGSKLVDPAKCVQKPVRNFGQQSELINSNEKPEKSGESTPFRKENTSKEALEKVPESKPEESSLRGETKNTINSKANKHIEQELERTLHHAVLLAGFFLHQPSAAENQFLNNLDAAIQQTKTLDEKANKVEALKTLKDAYRNVLKRTYPHNKVSGRSIQESQTTNPYLFGIPFVIAALVLVLMPLLLLFQIITKDLFVTEVASNFHVLLSGMGTFLWGGVGALTAIAVTVARLVRKRSYLPGKIAGVGLIGAVGGVLGLTISLVFDQQHFIVGQNLAYLKAMAAYLTGCVAAFCLHSRISRKKRSE